MGPLIAISLDKVFSLSTDQPEVSAEQNVVHGGLGKPVELSCLVYANPEAEVVWYRETM